MNYETEGVATSSVKLTLEFFLELSPKTKQKIFERKNGHIQLLEKCTTTCELYAMKNI
jgi:hypothetical protein